MKKISIAAIGVLCLGLGSCSTISHTTRTEGIDTEVYSRTTAKLNVSPNLATYTYNVDLSHQRAGIKSCKAAAVQALLENNGNAAVLVAPTFEVKTTRQLFGTRVKYVKVSGYPATYTEFNKMNKADAEVINLINYPQVAK